jgi:hypothetical protein
MTGRCQAVCTGRSHKYRRDGERSDMCRRRAAFRFVDATHNTERDYCRQHAILHLGATVALSTASTVGLWKSLLALDAGRDER